MLHDVILRVWHLVSLSGEAESWLASPFNSVARMAHIHGKGGPASITIGTQIIATCEWSYGSIFGCSIRRFNV
jgi:hypothetical protein